MNHIIHYTSCPSCAAGTLKQVLSVTDRSVSKEIFPLVACSACTLRITQDVPCETAIQRYYQSQEYVSHTDDKKGLINSLYHLIRKFTLRKKVKLLIHATQKNLGMHLDIGAGTGAFVKAMEDAGWNTIGLEPDDRARERAVQLHNVSVYPGSELSSLQDESYDAITMWHVLEHVHDLNFYIQQLHRLLNSNGKLFIAVPNYTSFDATYYGANWAAYDVPRHLYHFSPTAMQIFLEKNGFRIIRTKRMWFDSFYVGMLSEKNKNGFLLKGFLIGFVSNIKALFRKTSCSSLIYIIEKKP
jgi:2-polyprenyl-3-methyl-5-hydroxy-6-metoxy-1,4-benzoquinol methylase